MKIPNTLSIHLLMLLVAAGAIRAHAQTTRVWTNTASATAWYTAANWAPSTTSGAWATNDTARFENSGSATTAGINMNTAQLRIGGIEMTAVRTRALTIGNSSTTAGTLTLNGATINSIPHVIVRNASGNNLTLQDNETGSGKTMNIALGNTITNRIQLDGGGNITISTVISNTAPTGRPLVFAGAGGGRVEITGTANTYLGTITLLGPEVRFQADGSFGNSTNAIIINGGRLATMSATTYTLAATRNIFVSDNANNSISVVSSGTLTYNGVIADLPSTVGTWAKQGGATLSLGGVSTYSGDTRINNGTVQLTTGDNRLPTNTVLYLGQSGSSNLGELDLNGRSQAVAGLNSTAGSNSSTNKNRITTTSAATLTLGGTGAYSFSAATAANSGYINGPVTLIKNGSGTQFFGEANFYTGKTTINGGALAASGESRFGSNPGSFVADQITLNGGAIRAQGGALTFNSNRGLTLGANGGSFDAADGDITLQNVVAGSGALTKIGARNVILSGAHTYSGNTLIAEGGLRFSSGGSIANSTNITISGSTTVDVSSVGYTVPSGQSITAPGNGTTGVVLTASGNNLSLGSSTPLRITEFNPARAPLRVEGAGNLNLAAGTPVTVVVSNGGTALGAGTYRLIAKGATGSVGGTAPTSVTVSGDGLVGGGSASLTITSGELFLTVTTGGPAVPTVSTTDASATNLNWATAGGNVTADGGASVTNRGVVWALSPGTPTVPGAQTTNGTGTGSFTSSLTNLIPGATYHYRAFAQNSAGTGYGSTLSLTTPCFTGVVLNVRASATNENDFTAAWDAFAHASGYQLDVSTSAVFSSGSSTSTIFRETMGTVGATTAISAHEAANGFDNTTYTMSDGGAANAADVRATSTSTGYTDPLGNAASAAANIFFTSTTGDRGFSIAGINAAGYGGGFLLHFGYRKEGASENATYSVEWSTNNGSAWNTIAISNMPSSGAAAGWYFISNLYFSGAASSTNLSLRWVKTGSVAMRVDDVLLQGISGGGAPSFVPGYSNRAVSGESQIVTGLASGVTYYFRVRATNAYCATDYSATQSVTTITLVDSTPPTLSGFNFKTNYTDYEMRSGFSITGLVMDAGGISNAAHTPFLFILNNSNQFVLASNKFDVAPANGTTTPGALSESFAGAAFSNITIGVYTATVGALDLAGNLGLSNVVFTVTDDDTLPPATDGFRLSGGDTNINLAFSSVAITGLVGDASLPFGSTNGTAHALVYNSAGSIVASGALERTSYATPTNNFFGYLAIIGFDSSGSGNDEFTFVALREIPAGQTIVFTDRGYSTNVSPRFRIDEQTDIWTAPIMIKPGTVLHRFNTLNLSDTGDQIFALTNAVAITNDLVDPGFLHGVNFNGSPPPWQSDNGSQNDSTAPTNLPGIYNIDVYEHQAAFYSGIRTGTAEQILTAIANTANWTRIVSGGIDLTTNMQPFTVLQSVTGTISTLGMSCSSDYTVRVVVVDADVDRAGDQRGITNLAVVLRTMNIPGPGDTPVATNLLLNSMAAGTNAILTDAQIRIGGWNLALGFAHPVGVATSPAPSYRITNSAGIALTGVALTNPTTSGTSRFYTNPAPPVAYAGVALGTYSVQWSAENLGACAASVTNSSVIAGGTNTFVVIDNDSSEPEFFEFTINGVGGSGSSNLLPGAIALIGVNGAPSTLGERFSFVVLAPFPAGTRLLFTDCGWDANSNNWYNIAEFHTNTWVASGNLDVGSVVQLGLTNINNAGDQVVVYQYSGASNPTNDPNGITFLTAINLGPGWFTNLAYPGGGTNNQNSMLYRGLTNGVNAVSVPIPLGAANARYIGPTTGAASFILGQINNATNWQAFASGDITITNYTFNITGPGNFDWNTPELSDAQVLAGGYRVTNIVRDLESGIIATNKSYGHAPFFKLYNTSSVVIVSNEFAVNFADGTKTPVTNTMSAPPGVYETITLGLVEAVTATADNDNDRLNDTLFKTNRANVLIYDDDPDAPVAGTGGVRVLIGTNAVPATNRVELVAGWNFNTASARAAVSAGSGTMNNTITTTNSNSGTTLNAYESDPAGDDFTVQAAANIGRSIGFEIDMTGRKDLVVSFAAQRSATGYDSNIVAFAVGTGAFTTVNAAWNPPTSFAVQTFDLSSYPEINGAASVQFRITFGTNANSGAGNNRFDNFQFNAGYLTYYEVTDGELATVGSTNPLRFSFNAYDVYSGLARGTSNDGTNMAATVGGLATNNTANYQASLSSANTTNNVNATSVWQFASMTYSLIGDLYADGKSNRAVRATMGDADNDRPNDTAYLNDALFGVWRVIDDDTNTPALADVAYPNAASRPFIVLTNGGTFAAADTVRSLNRRTGSFSNTVWTLSDGDLAASGTIGLQFSFGARDVHSGVSRSNTGDTNTVMSFSMGSVMVGNVSNYSASLSTSQTTTNQLLTNVWSFGAGTFGYSYIGTLMATNIGINPLATTTRAVWVTIPDTDDDRPNDRMTLVSQQVGFIRITDDDARGPVIASAIAEGTTGNEQSYLETFEPAQGWTNTLSFSGSWTNTVSNGTYIASGSVLWGSLNPKVSGTRRIGLLTNEAATTTWLQLPGVTDPGTFTVFAGRFGGEDPTNDVGVWLERLSGTNWVNLGTQTVSALNPEFEMLSWNVNVDGVVTLRLVRAALPAAQVYLDDLNITPNPEWVSTNQLTIRWSEGVDDFSGLDEYRLVMPAIGNVTPNTTNAGLGLLSSVTSHTASIAGQQGVITGFVFAIDDDNDRPADRALGTLKPLVVRVDTNPPPRATELRATDAAGGVLFDPNIDESSEIKVEWKPGGTNEAQASGWRASDSAALSPWDSYVIRYYEVSDTNGTPAPGAVTVTLTKATAGWTNVLNNWAFTNLVLSNLQFDTYYRIELQGRDTAGNIGLATSVIGNTDRFIVTQGVTRANLGLDLRWTGPTNETVLRDYDVIFVDAPQGFRNTLTSQWNFLQYTNRPRLEDYGGTNRVAPGLLTGTTYRFYRVARQDRWKTNQNPRVGSAEIYAAKAIRLNPGENWYSLFSFPDPATDVETESTVAYVFGTNTLPAGTSYASSTKISWFANTTGVNFQGSAPTSIVWLSSSAGWQHHLGGSGSANNKRVPLGQGFLIELPTNAAPTNLVLVGRLATQALVRTIPAVANTNVAEFHVLSQQMAERIAVSNFVKQFNGFVGGVHPNFADEIRVLNNQPTNGVSQGSLVQPRMRIWLSTIATHTNAPWRQVTSGSPSAMPSAMGLIIEPDDSIIIVRRKATTVGWTNAPTYSAPTKNFSP